MRNWSLLISYFSKTACYHFALVKSKLIRILCLVLMAVPSSHWNWSVDTKNDRVFFLTFNAWEHCLWLYPSKDTLEGSKNVTERNLGPWESASLPNKMPKVTASIPYSLDWENSVGSHFWNRHIRLEESWWKIVCLPPLSGEHLLCFLYQRLSYEIWLLEMKVHADHREGSFDVIFCSSSLHLLIRMDHKWFFFLGYR